MMDLMDTIIRIMATPSPQNTLSENYNRSSYSLEARSKYKDSYVQRPLAKTRRVISFQHGAYILPKRSLVPRIYNVAFC